VRCGLQRLYALCCRAGSFNVAVRELLNYYVAMEEFVMEKDVQTAISIRELSPGNLTTSMVSVLVTLVFWLLLSCISHGRQSVCPALLQVDDVFFVLARCGRRALGTASAACVCAVLGQANALLGSAVSPHLRSKLEVKGRSQQKAHEVS
jgi:COG4 transport protein